MISYIKGELTEVFENEIVVENQEIGYEIKVPYSVIEQLPSVGNKVKVYTYMYVREDALCLYGFLTRDDLNIFQLLIGVNGIGPKAALGILSVITPDDLRFAILADDVKAISKAPGIGAKTASKLILELKDKIKLEDAFEIKMRKEQQQNEQLVMDIAKVDKSSIQNDAIAALVALGYSNSEALKAVRQVTITDTSDVEAVLKAALKHMNMF